MYTIIVFMNSTGLTKHNSWFLFLTWLFLCFCFDVLFSMLYIVCQYQCITACTFVTCLLKINQVCTFKFLSTGLSGGMWIIGLTLMMTKTLAESLHEAFIKHCNPFLHIIVTHLALWLLKTNKAYLLTVSRLLSTTYRTRLTIGRGRVLPRGPANGQGPISGQGTLGPAANPHHRHGLAAASGRSDRGELWGRLSVLVAHWSVEF